MKYIVKKTIASLVVLTTLLNISVVNAQNGKTSKPNELQKSLKTKVNKKLPVMGKTGKKLTSFTTIKKFPAKSLMQTKKLAVVRKSTQSGKSMPSFNGQIKTASKGRGEQQASKRLRNLLAFGTVKANKVSKERYLHLVMEVTKSGDVKVLSATNLKGNVKVNKEALGDFIYKVNIANKDVLVQAISDPFERRAFPGPEGSGKVGHHFEQINTARIIVKIPKVQLLKGKLNTIKMEMFKLKPGSEIKRIDSKIFRSLKSENRLQSVVKIPTLKLAPQIKQRMKVIKQ